MSGWETLVAALGGLSVGAGLGILIGRRGEGQLRRQLAQVRTRTRSSVLPVLERRAEELDIPTQDRQFASNDPVELALLLSESVARAEEKQELPFSDTVELSTGSLSGANATQTKEQPRE